VAPTAVAILLVAAGCTSAESGDSVDGSPTGPPADSVTDGSAADAPGEGDDSGDDGSSVDEPGAELGTVSVEGAVYSITELRNCVPLSDDVIEGELELQGIGTSADGERVQIDVYVETLAGQPFNSVSWAGPEGVWGNPEDAAITFAGDRVSGSATLVEALTQEGALPIEFDLEVPADLIECR